MDDRPGLDDEQNGGGWKVVADRALSDRDCLERATGSACLTIAKYHRRTCWEAQRGWGRGAWPFSEVV
jgi:hypothetical protein